MVRISFCREMFGLPSGVLKIIFPSTLSDFSRTKDRPNVIFRPFKDRFTTHKPDVPQKF